MSSDLSPDTVIKPKDAAMPGESDQDKDQPFADPAKLEASKKQVPIRSTTILNEGPRVQDSKYPSDRPGEAAGENGRAWKVYKDRVKDIDDDLLEGWNDTLNTLLIFAGLFSAACTAFLIEVSKNLQPDWQQATSLAVFAIYLHLNSTSPTPFDVPNPKPFAASTDVRWINGLWFTSLTLSLVVSLLAILAKQWLNEFKSRMRAPVSSPKMWALRHNAFKGGLERWGMDAFISTLPMLLHAALFSFLAGLCLLLMPLDDYIVGVVIGITGLLGVFYLVAGLAPLVWGDCPSAAPMLRYLYFLWSTIFVPAFRMVVWAICVAYFLLVVLPLGLVMVVTLLLDLFLNIVRCSCSSLITDFYLDRIESPIEEFFLRKLPSTAGLNFVQFPKPRLFRLTQPIHTVLRYRPRTTLTPAFDQAKILATDEPLREASVLTWMIRSLPAEDDIQVALCAAGWLQMRTHHAYWSRKGQKSPLVHADIQRAAVDALNNVAVRNDALEDITIASLLRACLFVSVRRLDLSDTVKVFLARFTTEPAHDLRTLSLSNAHSGDDWVTEAAPQLGELPLELAELVALSGSRGLHWRPKVITRLVIVASRISASRFPESIVSALELDILEDKACRKSGWKPRLGDDLRLRFMAALGTGLRHPEGLNLEDYELSAILAAYGSAARSLAIDDTVISVPDIQDHLHLTTSGLLNDYELELADLNAIGALLCLVPTNGAPKFPRPTLFGLLGHFKRRSLVVESDTVRWIQQAFNPPSDPLVLVSEHAGHASVNVALLNSHLRLLQPVPESKSGPGQSPWARVLAVVPISDNSELLAEMCRSYTTLILIICRRGYRAAAQALLRELLPHEYTPTIIARAPASRYHLVLHAKVISRAWWTNTQEQLMQLEPGDWVPCDEYAEAAAFVTAVSVVSDCSDCSHDDIQISWGMAPVLPDGNEPESQLTVSDRAVWNPARPTIANVKTTWYAPVTRAVLRTLRISSLQSRATAGRRDVTVQSGPMLV